MKFENIVKFNWQDNSQLFFSLKHIFNYDFISMQNYCYFIKTLLEYMEELTKLVDEGLPVDMLYLDFSKAFDLVLHRRLMVKLRGLGVMGKVTSWVEEWLGDRKQRVVHNGETSDWGDIFYGVVQ